MKNFFTIYLLVMLISVVACEKRVELQFSENLLPNGSFEMDSDSDGVPDGWTITAPDWSLSREESKDGSFALKMTGSGGVHKWKSVISPEVTVTKGDSIHYRLWSKTTSDSIAYDLIYWLQKWDGHDWITIPTLTSGGPTVWTLCFYPKPYENSMYIVEPGVTKIRACFYTCAANEVGHDWYVDKVEIIKIHYKDIYYRIKS